MPRTSRPSMVTLGEFQESVDARVRSGRYASVSDVLRAALRALDREEAMLAEALRDEIAQSVADPRPDRPAEDVFARLRAHHRQRLKAARNGA